MGPVDRFRDFERNLDAPNWSGASFLAGWKRLMVGVLFKFVVAESIWRYWLARFPVSDHHASAIVANALGYTVVLYFDFAGYSNMAIGSGMLFGIRLPENFDHPFFARNMREFWRRWHISLSTWFGDYVFRPLYTSLCRQSRMRMSLLWKQTLCLFTMFALMGLWNGLRLRYIVSGALFGLFTAVHNAYSQLEKRRRKPRLAGVPEPIRHGTAVALTFVCVCVAFYCFSGRVPWIAALERSGGG
jgi:membrane protein involved in D-alanine export